jgi:hypothetical protein
MSGAALRVAERPKGDVLNFVTLKEFQESDFSEREWVLHPFVKEGSSMMIYGRQGVGKSSVTIQLIDSLTNGTPWLGFETCMVGKVLYLQLDMSQAESLTLFERAEAAGYSFDPDLVRYPLPPEGEEIVHFNILDPAHEAELAAWVDHEQPLAVIVDTIADSYESDGRMGVNEEIRRALRGFRRACGKAVFIYLQHERKKPPKFGKAKEAEDDADSFMGGQAFEAAITASVQLQAHGTDHALNLRKVRLAPRPCGQVRLVKDENGFFFPKSDHVQMLLQWPWCLGKDAPAALAAATSKNDVFRDIATRCGISADGVKKVYQRARSGGQQYGWEAHLEGKGT